METTTKPDVDVESRLAPMYRVLLHNDDKTPVDFVVFILQDVFKKEGPEAVQIMLEAHQTGVALVAVEPLEQAEFHVEQVKSLARPRGYPLTCTYEPET